MKSIRLLVYIGVSGILLSCASGMRHASTTQSLVSGNCGMCKTNIENAGNKKAQAQVSWDKESKLATLTYDANRTSPDEILKRIALAGYDNESYLAPDQVYASLPECCKYIRNHRMQSQEMSGVNQHKEEGSTHLNHMVIDPEPFQQIMGTYFEIKNGLVNSEAVLVAENARNLSQAINSYDTNALSLKQQTAWEANHREMIVLSELISETTDITKQRSHFIRLSERMYNLMKEFEPDSPVYLQHCPMADSGKGANWLSKEEQIRNPYFGAKMLQCGSTVEVIQKQ